MPDCAPFEKISFLLSAPASIVNLTPCANRTPTNDANTQVGAAIWDFFAIYYIVLSK
jgi:hypothetical protein